MQDSIATLRAAKGMTLADLGRACGVSESAAQRWETGASEPRRRHRAKLAKALGVNVAVLAVLLSRCIDRKSGKAGAA